MSAIAQRRVAGATALMILLYLLQVALFAPMADANQGNPPSVECASELWNGKYYKIQVNGNSLGGAEGTGSIGISGVPGSGTWTNNDSDTVFRVLYKVGAGVGSDEVYDGSWPTGTGDALLGPNGLSHITWCFTSPTTTTTTQPTTTTTQPTTTTTQPTTTTTQPTTTTTQPTTTTTQPTTTTTQPTVTTMAPPPGVIIIVKETTEPTDESYDFSLNGFGFSLGSGESITFPNQGPGTYTVTELDALASGFDGVSCDDVGTNVVGASATRDEPDLRTVRGRGPLVRALGAAGIFRPEYRPDGEPFCRGDSAAQRHRVAAHGHGLNHTIHDVVIRRKRMQGYAACGSRAPTTPGSPPRTWSSGNWPTRASPATTWAGRPSSNRCGSGSASTAPGSRARSGAWGQLL
jgi:hypothetical protein